MFSFLCKLRVQFREHYVERRPPTAICRFSAGTMSSDSLKICVHLNRMR